ncbi:hypothetical protein B0H10DRAFT_1946828 [Mycena sp. CBHHK59/15]|nr:hypothetical protein B0H10DRAFT_1946828 [Mycena sp. CBHHK59/15]
MTNVQARVGGVTGTHTQAAQEMAYSSLAHTFRRQPRRPLNVMHFECSDDEGCITKAISRGDERLVKMSGLVQSEDNIKLGGGRYFAGQHSGARWEARHAARNQKTREIRLTEHAEKATRYLSEVGGNNSVDGDSRHSSEIVASGVAQQDTGGRLTGVQSGRGFWLSGSKWLISQQLLGRFP